MQDASINNSSVEGSQLDQDQTHQNNNDSETDREQTSEKKAKKPKFRFFDKGTEIPIVKPEDVPNEAVEPTTDSVEEEVKAPPTQEEFDALNDKYMRALAETANIRHRAERDVAEAAKFHSTRFARDLLPVHDNLKRALSSIESDSNESVAGVVEGIELTLKEFLKAVQKHGVEVIAPQQGDDFDSKLHEAMFQAPVKDVLAGKIVTVMTEGFTIHGRLLRPAQVSVSSGAPVEEANVEVKTMKEK